MSLCFYYNITIIITIIKCNLYKWLYQFISLKRVKNKWRFGFILCQPQFDKLINKNNINYLNLHVRVQK